MPRSLSYRACRQTENRHTKWGKASFGLTWNTGFLYVYGELGTKSPSASGVKMLFWQWLTQIASTMPSNSSNKNRQTRKHMWDFNVSDFCCRRACRHGLPLKLSWWLISFANMSSAIISLPKVPRSTSLLQTCLLLFWLQSQPVSLTSSSGCPAISLNSPWPKHSSESPHPTIWALPPLWYHHHPDWSLRSVIWTLFWTPPSS